MVRGINRRQSLISLGGLIAASSLGPTARAQAGFPPVWRARRDQATIWLIPGIHTLRADDTWLRKGVVDIISKADTVFIEAIQERNLRREIERTKLMVNPASARLSNRLPPAASEKYLQLTTELKLSNDVDRYRPVFAAEFVKGAYLARRYGFSPIYGVEAALAHYAQKGRLQALEDPLGATRAFASADEERALLWLAAFVVSAETNAREHVDFVERWRKGDLVSAEAYARRNLGEGDAELWDAVVDKRQQAWLPKILATATGASSTVVGTGIAHMVGTGGLPALLRNGGFQVEVA